MNETAVVLNAVYKGTQMGLHSLDNIMDTVEDVNMRAHLRAEHTQYAEINERAAQQLARQAAKPIQSDRWRRWRRTFPRR